MQTNGQYDSPVALPAGKCSKFSFVRKLIWYRGRFGSTHGPALARNRCLSNSQPENLFFVQAIFLGFSFFCCYYNVVLYFQKSWLAFFIYICFESRLIPTLFLILFWDIIPSGFRLEFICFSYFVGCSSFVDWNFICL